MEYRVFCDNLFSHYLSYVCVFFVSFLHTIHIIIILTLYLSFSSSSIKYSVPFTLGYSSYYISTYKNSFVFYIISSG